MHNIKCLFLPLQASFSPPPLQGWAGSTFPMLETPMRSLRHDDKYSPSQTTTIELDCNTAHSMVGGDIGRVGLGSCVARREGRGGTAGWGTGTGWGTSTGTVNGLTVYIVVSLSSQIFPLGGLATISMRVHCTVLPRKVQSRYVPSIGYISQR